MTQTAAPKPVDTTPAPRDLQRESLEQIVRLSIDCAAEEQRIEREHTESLEQENSSYQKTAQSAKHLYQRRLAEAATHAAREQESIQSRYDTDRQAHETETKKAQRQFGRKKEEIETNLKKQVEQASWQAESTLVALEMRIDTDEQKSKREVDANKGKLADLEKSIRETVARFRMEALPPGGALDAALEQRLKDGPEAVLTEYYQQALNQLEEIRALARPRAMNGALPVVGIVIAAAVVAGVGWKVPADEGTKLRTSIGAGVAVLVVGIVLFLIQRHRSHVRVRAKIKEVYDGLMHTTAIARRAAEADAQARATALDRRVREARRKRDLDVSTAREKGRALQGQGGEQYRTALAEETLRSQKQLTTLEQEKDRRLAEAQQTRETQSKQIEQENAASSRQTQTQHDAALATIESKYQEESHALDTRWDNGLRAVTELLSAGGGIDPRLVDWNSPAWEHWKAPKEFSGQIRFGEMKVDLKELTEQVPVRLKLPESFSVPALLSPPARASLLVEADHVGRPAAIALAQMTMARLLTQMPAGRVKFTLFDPVGLGQSFAGFMHLADHDESLVGSRIWTEKEHMEQRLADLTEHMETVIQKYLRNEYATIDEYNAQAGELAEPSRYLVIADFPIGFEQETLRRLASIALSGPRCGVYTIILRDTRQPLPPGAHMEDILAKSVHLRYKNGQFIWDDAVFKRFPLRVDAPPDEKTLTELMDRVGKAAKEAKRVEVPFQSIAPVDGQFWSQSSKSDLRVPIGKSGATRLQSLRLGVGVAQHTLIAGKTGSGKSNLMHTIVTNLAMWYPPDEVEFYLVDFKKGVEFKAYATSRLPHARAIAVESDREFGLSVLQRVDGELSRRGTMFRDAGAQEIGAFRDKTGQKLPRTILLIDEFQEFFSEDDKIGQEASSLLDRLVRQGRAFGIHVVLGSQTIGGNSGLARSTLGQIAVRVALQCSEADSQIILGDNNSAARLLTRPGEAIYNDAGGLVEANSPFQIAFLPDATRERFLEHVRQLAENKKTNTPAPIIFEGNSAAAIRKNVRLMTLVQQPAWPPAASSVLGYIGEPVAIKEPSGVPFRRQNGANVLMIGQQEESAVAIFASITASIAAQQKPGEAIFYLLDGSPADSPYFGLLERVAAALPQQTKVVGWREIPEAINELAAMLKERQGDDAHAGPSVYLLLFGLQRYRLLRRQEDDFSFSKSDEPAAPKPDKQFAELLSEGPGVGLHTIIWADTPITLERTLERSSMRQFDHRILFQMSASDSSNLIDSPQANRLGTHRALLYSEEQGTIEKCRPYEVPDDAWLKFLADNLKNRNP